MTVFGSGTGAALQRKHMQGVCGCACACSSLLTGPLTDAWPAEADSETSSDAGELTSPRIQPKSEDKDLHSKITARTGRQELVHKKESL